MGRVARGVGYGALNVNGVVSGVGPSGPNVGARTSIGPVDVKIIVGLIVGNFSASGFKFSSVFKIMLVA